MYRCLSIPVFGSQSKFNSLLSQRHGESTSNIKYLYFLRECLVFSLKIMSDLTKMLHQQILSSDVQRSFLVLIRYDNLIK